MPKTAQIVDADFTNERSLESELTAKKFRQYGRENFLDFVDRAPDAKTFFESCSRLNGFDVPREFKTAFIDYDEAKLYPVANSPIMTRFERWSSEVRKYKGPYSKNFVETQKTFFKWGTAKTPKDAEFYGLSVIELVEKNHNFENFLKHLLAAIIYAWDRKLFSIERALKEIDKAENTLAGVTTMDQSLKDEMGALLSLYRGFIHMRDGADAEANAVFAKVHQTQPGFLTAVFHNALLEKRMGNDDNALGLVKQLFYADLERLRHAINQDDLPYFKYHLENASIYRVFREYQFAGLFEDISRMIDYEKAEDFTMYNKVASWLRALTDLDLDEYFDEKISKDIGFLTDFVERYEGNNNSFLLTLSDMVVEKFYSVVAAIKERALDRYNREMNGELRKFDEYIASEESEIDIIRRDIEKQREKLVAHFEGQRQEAERKVSQRIEEIESRLERMDKPDYSASRKAFANALTNSGLVAVLMVFTGGMVELLSNWDSFNGDMPTIIEHCLMAGVKWGGVVLALGVVLSVFAAFSKFAEMNTEKRRLAERIDGLSQQRDDEVERLQEKIDQRQDKYERALNERIEDINRRLEKTRHEKAERERELKQRASKETNSLFKRIDAIFEQ
ncbi:MAG: hypothetical protein GF419_04580 [Ignavibacteriales bacterium]|nr:hypothetical protein [Ignavibacteriales bacterium]